MSCEQKIRGYFVQNKSLTEWLEQIQSVHVTDMDLSLERVRKVAERLKVVDPHATIITVGGTNGKGSCVAGLEAIYLAAGYKVGVFTSPVLIKHNEYVRLNGRDALDEDFCRAFAKIELVRDKITLTPFEYTALAAFVIFKEANLDVWILEVGLGGRFDAVNVLDADVAIVASIGIDHTEWLGDTREKIAYEKAGIFRGGKPAICGDWDPPKTLIDYAAKIDAVLFSQGKEFKFEKKESDWSWWSEQQRLDGLPQSQLALQNLACVLMAIELLQRKLPVSYEKIKVGIETVKLIGRIQVIPGDVTQILDVSHNPAAAEFLATWLTVHAFGGKTRAVFSMLADKDIVGTLNVIKNLIDEWYIASLPVKRGASMEVLQAAFKVSEIQNVSSYASIKEAYREALQESKTLDRVVIFGSFHTVGEVLN